MQKILNDLATFTNDLNATTNSISNWLLATNNLVNENNTWKIKSVAGYFKQTLVRNLIPTIKTNKQWKDLYPFIYKFFNSAVLIGLGKQEIVNHQLLFSFNLFNLNSTNMVAISLPTKTINDEEQANNVITYIEKHQDAFLVMVIQNGLVTFNNNQLVFANNFDLQVAGWITANFNPFINLSIINNKGIISAKVNAVSSNTTYTFPTAIYQNDLKNIANQIAQLIITQNNNNHSFTSWFYAHYYELLTTKYVVKDNTASLTYVFTNLATYLPKLNLSKIADFNLPLFSKTIYQFTNVNNPNNSLSFNVNFAGVSSTKQVNIALTNNNQTTVATLNGIITYLNNHEQKVESYIANSNGVIMNNNYLVFTNHFIYDLNSFINNNLPAAFGSFSIHNNNGIITISTLANPAISSTTSFDFSLTKLQLVLESQVNQLAKYINALNTSQLAISKWLVATHNATYNHVNDL